MEKFNCLTVLVPRKKRDKEGEKPAKRVDYIKGLKTLQAKIEHPVESFETNELKSTSFSVLVPSGIENNSTCNVKMMSHESPVGGQAAEVAYEGEDEHEEKCSIKRDFNDFDLQAHEANFGNEEFHFGNKKMDFSDPLDTEVNEHFEKKTDEVAQKGVDVIQTGHLSDPGIRKAEFSASPKLKRSCSNLEMRDVLRKIADHLPPSKFLSFEELQELAEKVREDVNPGSPVSVMTHCSTDKVMLKNRSSSQILPSRSTKLWWKLFLWSHRNLYRAWTVKPQLLPISEAFNKQGGYSSDTLEPNRAMELGRMESPGSFSGEPMNKCKDIDKNDQSWGGFHCGVSGMWPQNQWMPFSTESSSFARVNEWVKDLETQSPLPINDGDNTSEGIVFLPSPETGKSPARNTAHLARHPDINLPEEVLQVNSVILSINSSSTVAHISGIGFNVIPTLSCFSSLRSVNLSRNFIVYITPGSLPKGLHKLNLSRNKINTIEGLRELTQLRVLDLSYNRISRIGHGLSNCTLIKELYLAGNKISDVEGLHRLLKLTVLDLSFNKITTNKALGQLVANYSSLLALNLLGNPIQSNISDNHLCKAVCGLLPKLVYVNKRPIKTQRAREMLTDGVAKAALGNGGMSSRRKAVKRASQGGSVSCSGHRSSMSVGQKSRHRSKSQTHHHLPLKSSTIASSSR